MNIETLLTDIERRRAEALDRKRGEAPVPLIIGTSWYAYAAGLIDGEGCIRIERRGRAANPKWRYYCPTLLVNMVDCRAIEQMQRLFGGTIRRKKNNQNANARDSYMWSLYGDNLRRLLNGAEPFLFVKKGQALAALNVLASTANNRRRNGLTEAIVRDRDTCVDLCARLNRRGIAHA